MSNLCLLDSVLRCKDAGRETELLPKPNELCILVEVERQYTHKIWIFSYEEGIIVSLKLTKKVLDI